MASVGTVVKNDVTSMAYNPAGIASLETGQASFFYQKGLTDDAFGRLTIGSPIGKNAFGLSIGYYNAGTVELYDGVNTTNANAQKDYTISLGYARTMGAFRAGTNIKYLQSTLIDQYTASAYAVDLGMHMDVSARVGFGAAIQNLGTGLKYDQTADPLPTVARMGASYLLSPGKTPATLYLDAPYFTNERQLQPAVGLSVAFGMLTVRGGYKNVDGSSQFTLGTGIGIGRTTVDYAFGLANNLDASHRLSLNMKFGGTSGAPMMVQAPAVKPLAAKPVSKNTLSGKPTATKSNALQINQAATPPARAFTLGGVQTVNNGYRAHRIYVVKEGDTLASIAKNEYGDARLWKFVYNANTHLVTDPSKLEVGQKIVLPN
jgi:LysM repeat protein